MAIIGRTMVVNILWNEFDVDMTRRSKWGNPYRIGKDGTRKQVIAKHMKWLRNKKEIIIRGLSNKWVIEHLHELKGKRLGCVCSPLPCHVNNIITLINERS